MASTKFSDLPTEKLIQNKKTIEIITYTLMGILIVLLILGLYITFTKGFTALLVIPFALSTIVFLNLKNIKDIKEELRTR